MKLQATSRHVGPLALLTGFREEEAEAVATAWHLDVGEAADDALYEIARVPWTSAGEAIWRSVGPAGDELTGIRFGAEDALVGRAGVVWLAPGRKVARIAIREDGWAPGDFDMLLGASLAHALAIKGWLPLHGMAAALGGIGLVALGRSMAGKSTLAAALLQAGARLVSDDFLLVGGVREGVQVIGLRRDLRLRESSWGLVPKELSGLMLTERSRPERKLLPRCNAPDRFLPSTTPRVLWYLDGQRGRSMVEAWPMAQSVAMSIIVEATSPLFVGARYRTERARLIPVMKALVESTSGYRVRLGTELLDSPARAVELLLERTLPGGRPALPSDA